MDWTPVFNDHISFTFHYGWLEGNLDNVKLMLGTDTVPSTSIYFEKDGEKYFVKTVEKEFVSKDFKYFASPSRYTITSFNHHEHLVLPFELYNYDETGSFSICVYYEAEGSEKLLTKASLYFERHGGEIWFANNPNVFDNYN